MIQSPWRTSRYIQIVLGLSILLTATSLYPADWTESPPPLSDFDNPDFREWLPSAGISPETSIQLNDLGYEAYLKGRLVEAAELWKASLQMDPGNPWPHYNYASVLAVFAQGFGEFDAAGDRLPNVAWKRDDFWTYRETIIHHLKISITLSPERLSRVQDDSDFDSIRRLPEFINVVMGPYPDVDAVLSHAPRWYSLQPGAFLPKDILTFDPSGKVEYQWDASGRLEVFPDLFSEGEDQSFSGSWRAVGDSIEIETDDGRQINCRFDHKTDENGFVTKRVLIFDGVGYGDYDAHYWEGQDG